MRELRARDAGLFWAGVVMLLALLVCTLLSIGDNRLVLGINPWIKPMKFLTSITIFLWTLGWFMDETQDLPRSRRLVRNTAITAMGVEIVIIIAQAARGTTSHYNVTSALNGALFSIMGFMITINTVAMARFLWIIRRDTPPHRAGYLWGVRIGVALFILASLQGFLMVANNAHTVPAPDGGPGLPFVNWSTTHGDLRIAHFFGMHAMQALPILGFLLDRAGLRPARSLVFAAGILWLAVMGGLLTMALQGRPFLTL